MTTSLDDLTQALTAVARPAEPGSEPDGLPIVELAPAVVQIARAAAVQEAGQPGAVGDLLRAVAEDDVAVTVTFDADLPGYRGWCWTVTIAGLPPRGDDDWTVSEVVLLPGDRALLAPPWVPWEQRIRGGDIGPGDLLPAAPDDPRLVPGYLLSDDPAVQELAGEVGLGRVRVFGRDGRLELAERWHTGSFGPAAPMAVAAPGHCGTCAFYLPLAGSLGAGFGACGNEFGPADGHVVDVAYGCGAHSEQAAKALGAPPDGGDDLVIDELQMDLHYRPPAGAFIAHASGELVSPFDPTGLPILTQLAALLADAVPPVRPMLLAGSRAFAALTAAQTPAALEAAASDAAALPAPVDRADDSAG